MPHRTRSLARLAPLALLPLLSFACASPTNPSFPVSTDEAKEALWGMADDPKPLARPLVIVGGYLGPGLLLVPLRCEIRSMTDDDRIKTVTLATCCDFDDCRRRIIASTDRAFPTDDPNSTTEVDVIAVSMGGLAARYAAAPVPPGGDGEPRRRLRIARLFTISSPHRGANLADLPTFHRLACQMRRGSDFLADLRDAEAEAPAYPIYPYVRLGDFVVGQRNAAPFGRAAWWVPTPFLQEPHLLAPDDPRIIADIARRLRGEEPFTRDPPAPLPK